MKIVADANMPLVAETFGRHGEVIRCEGRDLSSRILADADVLLVRSVTRVNRTLLENTAVRFVGSATIGTDHMDIPWLELAGRTWAAAPGCNADAAAQYTVAMLLLACRRLEREPLAQSVGIVGYGNVGSRVSHILDRLGIAWVANDPLLREAGKEGLVDLEQALTQSMVSLHTPLTSDGPYPTCQLLDARTLAGVPDGGLIINTSRGDVIHDGALLNELRSGRLNAALDVWPGEPQPDPALVQAAAVATPHVAGYSEDGKRNGTLQVYAAFCRWARIQPVEPPALESASTQRPDQADLAAALLAVCPVERDDANMRAVAGAEMADSFDRLRRSYPPRRDLAGLRTP